jgi:hypothetical protein
MGDGEDGTPALAKGRPARGSRAVPALGFESVGRDGDLPAPRGSTRQPRSMAPASPSIRRTSTLPRAPPAGGGASASVRRAVPDPVLNTVSRTFVCGT